MARTNNNGTSFLGLGLVKQEEKKLKEKLKKEDLSAKQLIRKLVRDYINE